MTAPTWTCPVCGLPTETPECPFCTGRLNAWTLRLPLIPGQHIRPQVAGWLGHLHFPAVFELAADTTSGFQMRFYAAPGSGEAAATTWASLVHQQARWEAQGIGTPIRSGGLALAPADLAMYPARQQRTASQA